MHPNISSKYVLKKSIFKARDYTPIFGVDGKRKDFLKHRMEIIRGSKEKKYAKIPKSLIKK